MHVHAALRHFTHFGTAFEQSQIWVRIAALVGVYRHSMLGEPIGIPSSFETAFGQSNLYLGTAFGQSRL